MRWALYTAGLLLIAAGFIGVLVPALPGAPLIFAGIVLVAWADRFAYIGWPGLAVTGALAAVISLVDLAAGALGARGFGASRWGLAGAVLGAIVGLVFGLPGLLLGPVVGAILLEYAKEPDLRRAARAGVGACAGFLLGTAVKYALVLALLGAAAFFYFVG